MLARQHGFWLVCPRFAVGARLGVRIFGVRILGGRISRGRVSRGWQAAFAPTGKQKFEPRGGAMEAPPEDPKYRHHGAVFLAVHGHHVTQCGDDRVEGL
jgi:hypothetical protein